MSRPWGRRGRGARVRGQRRAGVARFEALERRALLASYLVTDPSDGYTASGDPLPNTLRWAITEANLTPERDHIYFALPDPGGLVIRPIEPLPPIVHPLEIHGYSQAGSAVNDTQDDRELEGDVAVVRVQLDGSGIDPNKCANGLTIVADTCVISGLSITGFAGAGIELCGPSSKDELPPGGAVGNWIWGNFIGTVTQDDPELNGSYVDPTTNLWANGVGLRISGPNNRIGGTVPWARNLIQGNRGDGIVLEGHFGTGNLIEGNLILDNGGDGVDIRSSNNFIGEPIGEGPSGGGNVISGNRRRGIHIHGVAASGNTIQNNEIGTDIRLPNVANSPPFRGTLARPNHMEGIFIRDAPRNTIGGLLEWSRNTIGGNTGDGIRTEGAMAFGTVIQGNDIGFNIRNDLVYLLPNADGIELGSPENSVGGTVEEARNRIASNHGHGIRIGGADNLSGMDLQLLPSVPAPEAIPTTGTNTVIVASVLDLLYFRIFDASGKRVVDTNQRLLLGRTTELTALRAEIDPYWGLPQLPQDDKVRLLVAISNLLEYGYQRNVIEGNFIGTILGGDDYGNAFDGVHVEGVAGNIIGGTEEGSRNVIVGNNHGVVLVGTNAFGNVLRGNFIGVAADGVSDLGNARYGVWIENASWNSIGGAGDAARNVISANNHGLGLFGPGAMRNRVENNAIGTDLSGSVWRGNAIDGVRIAAGASENTIGGVSPGLGNVIAYNVRYGVLIESGVDNTLLSNLIHHSGNLGIHLEGGANRDQLAPNLTAVRAFATWTIFEGSLAGVTPGTTFRVQFFASDEADPSGKGEGQRLVGSILVTADGTGAASFSQKLTTVVAEGHFVSATATRQVTIDDPGDSSAFGESIVAISFSTTVINTRDDGSGSLRRAIENANANPGPDLIDFQLPADENDPTFHTDTLTWHFQLLTPLPAIEDETIIDGFTQRATEVIDGVPLVVSSIPNNREVGNNAKLRIVLDGGQSGFDGLVARSKLTLRGVVLDGFANALTLEGPGASGSVIQGNFIGIHVLYVIDPVTRALTPVVRGAGNNEAGIRVEGADGVLIGGTAPATWNQIAGNSGPGVAFDAQADDGTIAGNLIGLVDAGTSGVFPRGNGEAGVFLAGARGTVGGTETGARNVISGNGGAGVFVGGPFATGNRILGNYLGTGLDGLASFGQGQTGNRGAGVEIQDAPGNTVGGASWEARNLISGNVGDGVLITGASASGNVVLGNAIGLDRDGLALPNLGSGVRVAGLASDNLIGGLASGAGNTIVGNNRSGVHLESGAGNAVLSNVVRGHLGAGIRRDAGANRDQEAPALTSVTSDGSRTRLVGTVQGPANSTLTVQFFANAPGGDEGEVLLATLAVRTDSAGLGSFDTTLPVGLDLGRSVTATATAAANDSSAYSFAAEVGPFTVAGTIFVTNTNDSGPGSLRQAILDANANPGPERIAFRIPAPGLQTILPLSPLPVITDTLVIDGFSQEGSAPNTVPVRLHEPNAPHDLTLRIEIRGTLAGPDASGLVFRPPAGHTTSNSRVQGVIVSHFAAAGIVVDDPSVGATGAHGVSIFGSIIEANGGQGIWILSSNNRVGGNSESLRTIVQGNRVGVEIAGPGGTGNRVEGTFILDNRAEGVLIRSSNNAVGDGGVEGGLNVISGNEYGVRIVRAGDLAGAQPQGNEVLGNLIGTDIDGFSARPNRRDGIFLDDSPGNRIGGLGAASRNVLAGNDGAGLRIAGPRAVENRVLNNYVGFNQGELITLFLGNEDGIVVESARNSIGGAQREAQNTISSNRRHGLVLRGAAAVGNVVIGNVIGANPDGGTDYGNTLDGIRIEDAPGNRIGGTETGAGNLVSGNNNGITLVGPGATGNRIEGNLIGTMLDGRTDLGNAVDGLRLLDAPANTIGGNVISGNNRGVRLAGAGTTQNLLQGNAIGSDITGEIRVGNEIDGVLIEGGASANTLGGTAAGAGNIIRYNLGDGVRILSGVGQALLSNSIDANGGLGIDLGGDGPSPNDPGDGDDGPNGLQDAPVLTAVIGDGERSSVQGTLDAAPSTTYTIQVFASPVADSSGRGEGRSLLGTISARTDVAGHARFALDLDSAIPFGSVVSAIATDPGGNSSEFSNSVLAEKVVVQFSAELYEVDESDELATIIVTRSGGLGAEVSVRYATTSGSAVAGVDYEAVSGILTFAPGEVSRSFTVPIHGDDEVEGGETVLLVLSDSSAAVRLGAISEATLAITSDDEPLVHFSVGSYVVTEGGQATVTVVRNTGAGTASVRYCTVDGTALAGLDYAAVDGVLMFAPGELSKSFVVPILQDLLMEGDETLTLALSEASGASLGVPAVATITIRDDDGPGRFQFEVAKASVHERRGPARIDVIRTGGASGSVRVAYRTVSGTARAGADYTAVAGTLVFRAGETRKTILIPVAADGIVEPNETLRIQLEVLTPGALLGVPASTTLTIINDDRDRRGPVVTGLRAIRAGSRISGVWVHFNEPLDPARAQDLFNYDRRIVSAGRDGRFGTRDDVSTPLLTASYDPQNFRVRLVPSVPLPVGTPLRVRINRFARTGLGTGVADRSGNLLDGDRDGRAGGAYVGTLWTGPRAASGVARATIPTVRRSSLTPDTPVMRPVDKRVTKVTAGRAKRG